MALSPVRNHINEAEIPRYILVWTYQNSGLLLPVSEYQTAHKCQGSSGRAFAFSGFDIQYASPGHPNIKMAGWPSGLRRQTQACLVCVTQKNSGLVRGARSNRASVTFVFLNHFSFCLQAVFSSARDWLCRLLAFLCWMVLKEAFFTATVCLRCLPGVRTVSHLSFTCCKISRKCKWLFFQSLPFTMFPNRCLIRWYVVKVTATKSLDCSSPRLVRRYTVASTCEA